MKNNYFIFIIFFSIALIIFTILLFQFNEKKRFKKFIRNNQNLLENGFNVSNNRLTGVFQNEKVEISVIKVKNELKVYLGIFISAPTENLIEITNASELVFRKGNEGIWTGKYIATNKNMTIKISDLKELLREIII